MKVPHLDRMTRAGFRTRTVILAMATTDGIGPDAVSSRGAGHVAGNHGSRAAAEER